MPCAASSSRSRAARAPARRRISAFCPRRCERTAARCCACASPAAPRWASNCAPWCWPGERRHVRRGRAAHLRGRPRAADGAGHRARAGARGRGAVRPFHRFDGGLPGLREGLAAHVRRPRERVRLPGRASRPHHPHGHGRRGERGPRARDASGGGRPPRAGGRGVPCPRERGVSGNRPARPRARARGGLRRQQVADGCCGVRRAGRPVPLDGAGRRRRPCLFRPPRREAFEVEA